MKTETKKTASFTIYGRLDGLNEYILKCRGNRYAGANLKRKNEAIITTAIVKQIPTIQFKERVHITYKWYEGTKRRDLDNIAFSKKFIQDALVDMCVLKGDGWRHIAGFTDEFYIDKDNPRIEVIIREV
jgi:Holliday junction resolvase RusA-like endonuclease